MPTYQYACTECGHQLEAVQSFSDDALTTCPECTGKLRKLFSAVGVVFKGSGFYRTDSRGSSSASTPAAPSTGSTPKQGGESKPSTPAPAAAPAASS
ncbi:FmdB family zinc ribbon protein [Longispora sp. NPDC051575]|uniref:FmdB family zinc ribbon protein n=1 Tax=Longispora sp. NPDC051575 TaxID=3154943 RepID=UPI00343AC97C